MHAEVSERTESNRRQHLESLLRVRQLDRTLSSGGADQVLDAADARWSVPTGLTDLDARLGGGIPRGELSEITGPRSSGRLTIATSALARATAGGDAVALIDPLDMFDPVSASASGIDFTRMLWIRGEATSSARVSLSCEYGTLHKTLDRAVKAFNLVLQTGGFALVVLDLGEVAPQAIKRLPYTTWVRLQRVIEGRDTACVVMGSEPIARSARGVSVQLSPPQAGGGTSEAVCRARVIRLRGMDTDRHVCVPLSAAAC